MLFNVISERGINVSEGLDEFAPCIRVQEGRVLTNKSPLDLAVGERSVVDYPGTERKIRLTIERTD